MAIAERETERIDKDGLSGASLSREHIEASAELDLELIDDRVVANLH